MDKVVLLTGRWPTILELQFANLRSNAARPDDAIVVVLRGGIMASAKSSSELGALRRQMVALQRRVRSLEHALKPRKLDPERRRLVAAAEAARREWPTLDAQMTALSEYSKQERIQSYRERPESLEAARKKEEARDAFFRERGVKPLKSDLAAIAEHLAKEAKER